MSYLDSDPERMAEISNLLNNGMGEELTREELVEAVQYFAVSESLAYGRGRASAVDENVDKLCDRMKELSVSEDLRQSVRRLVGELQDLEEETRPDGCMADLPVNDCLKIALKKFRKAHPELSALIDGKGEHP